MFKKLFKRKKKKDESFLRSQLIYHSNVIVNNNESNIIILFSFTNDYVNGDLMELLSDISNTKLHTKLMQSSYDMEITNSNGDIDIISCPRHYLLIAGDSLSYNKLYESSNNLSNEYLQCITKEIYENINYSLFNNLIDDLIMSSSSFNKNNDKFEYIVDSFTYKNENNNTFKVCRDPVNGILKRLPSVFLSKDLIHICNTYIIKGYNNNMISLSYYDFISRMFEDEQMYKYAMDSDIFDGLLRHVNSNTVANLIMPIYRQENFDEDISGGLNDNVLDDIFKQQYDKFTGIVDDTISYKDIDEVLEGDNNEQ